ncbi:MAG: hypothetical protein LBN12_05440 [Clostridiales Family XIII bacterium]|jgi:hypothetical protein|nr:hypothetical protein [Clostridiales Family XIII bacterium]
MGTTSNEVKQNWNASHYTQIKVSVNPVTAERFKTFCSRSGVSMASELSRFMDKRADGGESHPIKTRSQRRKEIERLVLRLEQIHDAEEVYKDNIPENLQCGVRYEDAERSITLIGEAISILEEAY